MYTASITDGNLFWVIKQMYSESSQAPDPQSTWCSSRASFMTCLHAWGWKQSHGIWNERCLQELCSVACRTPLTATVGVINTSNHIFLAHWLHMLMQDSCGLESPHHYVSQVFADKPASARRHWDSALVQVRISGWHPLVTLGTLAAPSAHGVLASQAGLAQCSSASLGSKMS